jgi:HSP20 family molecular chaperone IbpA
MVSIELTPDPIKTVHYVLQNLQQREDSSRYRMANRSHVWRPPTDVFETEEVLVVRIEIAGMLETDFTIFVDERYLMIRGVRAETAERRAYHQMEIRFGEFGVDIELPYPVSVNEITAVYSNGFLRVILPKARPHRIEVED